MFGKLPFKVGVQEDDDDNYWEEKYSELSKKYLFLTNSFEDFWKYASTSPDVLRILRQKSVTENEIEYKLSIVRAYYFIEGNHKAVKVIDSWKEKDNFRELLEDEASHLYNELINS